MCETRRESFHPFIASTDGMLAPEATKILQHLAHITAIRHTLQFHDSLGASGKIYLGLLLRYLRELHNNISPGTRPDDWRLVPGSASTTPQQTNTTDCGAFTCAIADCLLRGAPLEFNQSHIPAFRELMASAIVHNAAPPWDSPFLVPSVVHHHQHHISSSL
jgi:hypothetical protein